MKWKDKMPVRLWAGLGLFDVLVACTFLLTREPSWFGTLGDLFCLSCGILLLVAAWLVDVGYIDQWFPSRKPIPADPNPGITEETVPMFGTLIREQWITPQSTTDAQFLELCRLLTIADQTKLWTAQAPAFLMACQLVGADPQQNGVMINVGSWRAIKISVYRSPLSETNVGRA